MLSKPESVLAALAALAALACSPLATAQEAPEGDPDRGRQLGLTCLGCHAIVGYRNAYPSFRVPKLGGQKAAYVVNALTAYREGTRPHPTMQAQAASLTDQEIADVAAWVAAAGSARDEVDAETPGLPEAAVPCIACHGTAGVDLVPASPILSGQHQSYLVHALAQYKAGARGTTVMNAFAAGLEPEQVEAITKFYSMREGLDTLGEVE